MLQTLSAPKPQLIDVSKLSAEAAVSKLIEHAATEGASDLFLVSNEQHVAVQIRHLGIVRPIAILSADHGRKVLGHIRASSGMDVNERRKPADGRWIFNNVKGEDAIDLRLNSIPTMYGEDLAIRLLTRGHKVFDIGNLGMSPEQLETYRSLISNPSGLILITGPTGSGKTATLYSTLMHLNNGRRKINTIEDPIEYAIDGLRQSQVNPAIDLAFPELLRSVLRQSPDVIMIGEIRDEETAQTAVRAANSGILVFATLHAASAPAAIQSMRGLGTRPHFLSTALRGIVAQRLVRTLCPKCRMSFDLSDAPHTFDDVRHLLSADEGKHLYAARGCEDCGLSGYAGRSGIFEIMPVDKDMRALIADNAPVAEIRVQATSKKMLEFRESAMLKVARGETSTEEVFRVVPTEHMLMEE